MCALYVSFGSKVRPSTFGCVAMSSAVLLILRSILLLYSAGSRVNRVQVVLSGFSARYFVLSMRKRYVGIWLYLFLGCSRVCMYRCDGDVICVGHGLTGALGGSMSAV